MQFLNKKMTTRTTIAFLFVFALVAGLPVRAFGEQAASQLQTQISDLLGKLDTAPASGGCVIPKAPLALGSRSAEVKKLQVWLGANGYPVVAASKESEYFGPLTHFALLKLQSAAHVQPMSGFYGPLTMAQVSKRCAAGAVALQGVTVRLSADTPQSRTLTRGAALVPVMELTLSGQGEVRSLTFRRFGDTTASGFQKAYLFDGDVRLTPGVLADNKTGGVVFSDLNMSLNGTKKLTLVVGVATQENEASEGFELESVDAAGAVSGSFPIRGATFTYSQERAGSVAVARGAIAENPTIGQMKAKIAIFRLTPSARDEDVLLRSLALSTAGNVNPALISNFVLKHNDETVAVASAINARGTIVLILSQPLLLQKGVLAPFELYADIAAKAEVGSTLQVYVDSPADIHAAGTASKDAVSVNISRYNNTTQNGDDASWVTIEGGVVTVSFVGPPVAHLVAGQARAELIRFALAARSRVEVRNVRFMLTAGGADAKGDLVTSGGLCDRTQSNYTDIRLVDAVTGQVVARGQETTCKTGGQDISRSLIFTDPLVIDSGKARTLMVTTNVDGFVPASNETIKATLVAFEDGDIRGTENNLPLKASEIAPPGNLVGATHTVHANAATASLLDTFAPIEAELSTN